MSPRLLSPEKPSLLPALLLVLLVVVSSGPIFADTITLQNGGRIEGRAIEQGDRVVIELPGGGRITLERSRIAKIERSRTPAEQLVLRERELPPRDAEALATLARWCDEKGLRQDRDRLRWRVLELSPDHREVREALGFRRLGALWLTEEEYRHHHGQVRDGSEWISREEWERRQRARSDARELDEVEDALETAARAGSSVEEVGAALTRFRAASPELRRWALPRALQSPRARLRQLAVRLTGELEEPRPRASLTHVAVHDGRRSVRDEALRVLRGWGDPDAGLRFAPYLGSSRDRERINAVRALNIFPDRRVVGALIETTEVIWAGFGRVHFAQVVQRAVVRDYELVSGGTGQVVSEVADPVVDTALEGVVLDVDIRRAEAISRIATLERITGQTYGADFPAWREWWQEEQGKGSPTASREEARSEPRQQP